MAVQSVIRAFDILKLVAYHPKGISVTEIARRTRLHKSTVSRLLATLEGVGVVERVPNGLEFQISADFVSLFTHAIYPQNLIALARPYLLELHTATGEDVGLAIPDGDEALYVDQVQSDQAVQVRDWTGTRFPLHTVAAGKVFLAYRSEAARQHYLSRPLEKYTEKTILDPPKLEEEMKCVVKQQYAWVFEEFAEGLNAVAAPIFDQHQQPIAAFGIYGPSFRFPSQGQETFINRIIVKAGQNFTLQLRESCRKRPSSFWTPRASQQ